MQKYLSLARKLDPKYKTNKWVLILMPVLFVAGVVYGYVSSAEWSSSLLSGLVLSFQFFFAWAIARELDPDHDYSAFVAAAIAAGMWWFGIYADLFVNFFLLMLLRLAGRSTGRKMLLADWIVLFALAGWVTIEGRFYVLPLLALVAFADYYLVPRNRGALIPALDAVVLSGFALYFYDWPIIEINNLMLWILATAVGMVLLLVFSTRSIAALADITQEPLHLLRLRLALFVSLLVIAIELLFYGIEGFWDVAPLVAAIAGAALYRPVVWIKSL